MTTRIDRDSDVIDLDFDDQLDAVIEERLSGKPPRLPGLDSSENITVRPPATETDDALSALLDDDADADVSDRAASNPEFAPETELAPSSEGGGGGVGLSWDYLRRQAPLPIGVRLRALVEVLSALTALHTDVARAPNKRFHGALWYGNLLFRNDGSALLLKDQSVTPQPTVYAAPELRRRKSVDQQVDCYAIGVMLLEALADQPLSSTEVNDLSLGDLGSHPFWGRLAGDPLLWVAVRATAREPVRRWPTAREFADALSECAFDRIASRDALGQLICAALFEQGDRATPLVSAPVSSRSPLSLPTSPLQARKLGAPTLEQSKPAPPMSPSQARGLAVSAAPQELSDSAGPSVRPSERSTTVVSIQGGDGDSGFGVAVSVAAARVPSFAEPPVYAEPTPKRSRRWAWLLAAVVLTGVGAFVLRTSPLPLSPTLAAERVPTLPQISTPGYAAGNAQSSNANPPNASAPNSKESAAPAVPGATREPATNAGSTEPAASAASASPAPRAATPGAGLNQSAAGKHASNSGAEQGAKPAQSQREPAKTAAPAAGEARSGSDVRNAEADKISKPRKQSRYEPDGI